MQDRSPSTFPLTNFILFVVLSFAILVGYSILMGRMRPPPAEKGEKSEKADKSEKGENGVKEQPAVIKPAVEAEPAPKEKPAAEPAPARPVAARPVVPPQWVTLGSIDPEDPYRMLVTLSNRGAALARIELSSDRYHDLEDRSGYLGHLVLEDGGGTKGCPVQVVGAGTPAAKAGLKPGDFITGVNDQAVGSAMDLEKALADTQPGKSVKLAVRRDGRPMELSATLIRRPLEIVRPETRKPEVFLTGKRVFDSVQVEDNVPLGMLATLQQIDGEKIPPDADPDNIEVARELKGLDLRTVAWEVVEPDREHVVFRCKLPGRGLEVTKTYRLAKVPEDALGEADADAYHLDFDFSIKNVDGKAHDVAYRLDGPNSLPHEGAWYATKVSRNWGGGGLRDVVYKLAHDSASQIGSIDLADEKSSSHKMAETSADKPFQ
ncbi:MAG: PDZ domain-containing protein, partial [Thermoguttaceae bacterium]